MLTLALSKVNFSIGFKRFMASAVPLLDDSKELSKLTKQGLIARVLQLQDHIQANSEGKVLTNNQRRKIPPARAFSFAKCGKRRIALKFAYLGTDYDGFASQPTTDKTIEQNVLEALKRTRLIPENENCFYSKAGRTDKGVSALEQVISLNIRSNLINVGTSYSDDVGSSVESSLTSNGQSSNLESSLVSEDANFDDSSSAGRSELSHVFVEKIPLPDWSEVENNCPIEGEINYLTILNRNTPSDIMFYAWAPVPKDFSARFHCSYRQYKYFFPKCQLNLELMRKGAALLVGKHNYQNFCKIDRTRAQMFERSIWEASVDEVDKNPRDDALSKCCFTVKAEGFLYHQVRYMISLLFSIGLGLESPETVSHLLDVENLPDKPQYVMASEQPLILHETGFNGIKWLHDQESLKYLVKSCDKMWVENFTRRSLIETVLDKLYSVSDKTQKTSLKLEESGIFSLTHAKGNYVPVIDRQKRKPAASPKKSRKRHHSPVKEGKEDVAMER